MHIGKCMCPTRHLENKFFCTYFCDFDYNIFSEILKSTHNLIEIIMKIFRALTFVFFFTTTEIELGYSYH